MDTEALKQKIIHSLKGINDEITLLEVLRFMTDNDAAHSDVREPETSYGQINSIQKESIVYESFYKVLDLEREQMIKNPKLAVECSEAEDLIFKD